MLKQAIPMLILMSVTQRTQADEIEYSVLHEILDWSFIALVTPLNFVVDSHDPYFDEPLMTSPYTDRQAKKTTVRGLYLHIESATLNALVGILPTNEGWMTHTNYVNIKGFAAGLFASNLLMNLTKNTVGRKRPFYDSKPDDPDARKSFMSGHALNSWYNWTYVSLFVFEHIGSMDNPWHLAGKVGVSTAGGAFAAWVCYTRVENNKHFVSDVVVGGLFGALSAVLFYAYQNEWLFEVYDKKQDDSAAGVKPEVSLNFLPNSMAMTVSF